MFIVILWIINCTKSICHKSKINIPEQLCVYIGDSIFDILAAQNANIDSIVISPTEDVPG